MLSVLRRWFCCCLFVVVCYYKKIVGFCNCSIFCCALLNVSILVLQSSLWGRESWLLCFVCLPDDCCVALPRGAMGLSAVCDCGIS